MIFIDTHTHLYLEQFDEDRKEVVGNAIQKGIQYMFLPNIDKDSIKGMMELSAEFPENCFPMIGLHPTSVGPDFREQLNIIKEKLDNDKFIAVGEIGIDLYWDKTYFREQEEAFRIQIHWANESGLPVAIHSRNSFSEIINILDSENIKGLKGVFHCFSGNLEEAEKVSGMGLKLGIGGVLTFRKSGLDKVVEQMGIEHMVLETDSPFLSPVPYRGKRNESAYIYIIAEKMAQIKGLTLEEVALKTTENALELFKIY